MVCRTTHPQWFRKAIIGKKHAKLKMKAKIRIHAQEAFVSKENLRKDSGTLNQRKLRMHFRLKF